MTDQVDRVRAAWAGMAEIAALSTLQIEVRGTSALGPAGWVRLLRIEDTVTVHVPDERTRSTMELALCGLSPLEAVSLDVLAARVPVDDTLGPASLFYATSLRPRADDDEIELVDPDELASLRAAVTAEELDESGLADVHLPASALRSPGREVIAVCGHKVWPFELAHLCVLTHPEHRGHGFAKRVAADALRRTAAAGMVPQWRARVEASKAVARAIGLTELGTQLRIRLADR